jgi:hypothetical protein
VIKGVGCGVIEEETVGTGVVSGGSMIPVDDVIEISAQFQNSSG